MEPYEHLRTPMSNIVIALRLLGRYSDQHLPAERRKELTDEALMEAKHLIAEFDRYVSHKTNPLGW